MREKKCVIGIVVFAVCFQMFLFPCDCPSNCDNWELIIDYADPTYYMWDVASCYMGTYFDHRWIAVGFDGRYWLFSENGMGGLSCSTDIVFPNHAYTICASSHEDYSDRRYVVAGHDGFISTTSGLYVRDWDVESSPVTTHLYASVYDSDNDRFVLAGQAGKVVMESPTGWIEVANAGASNIWNITYGNGRFVVCNVNGWVYTSTDLNSWTRRVQLDCVNAKTAVFGNGVYLIGGRTSSGLQVVYRSTDAINWTQHIMPWVINDGYIFDLEFIDSQNPKFIGVAKNRWIIESIDGITWTKKLSPAYPTLMIGIAYSCQDEAIMAVGGSKSIHSICTK